MASLLWVQVPRLQQPPAYDLGPEHHLVNQQDKSALGMMMCGQMPQPADSFAAVLLNYDMTERFDVLEHTGVCDAVDAPAVKVEWLSEINEVAQLENHVVLFVCWLL